jgi:hypothetical protein
MCLVASEIFVTIFSGLVLEYVVFANLALIWVNNHHGVTVVLQGVSLKTGAKPALKHSVFLKLYIIAPTHAQVASKRILVKDIS